MAEFNPTPYKGDSTVPHVPEDWFTSLFVGTQVCGGGKEAVRRRTNGRNESTRVWGGDACRRRAELE